MKGNSDIDRTEEEALLALSVLHPAPDAAARLSHIRNPWRFVWLANEHGVTALLLRNMEDAGLSHILPATEWQWLRNMSFKSMVRNSFIMDSMRNAAAILNTAGMVPVLLKGTALERTVYGAGGIRPMSDADILLPADRCLEAWELLRGEGFTAINMKSRLHRHVLMHTGKHLPTLVKGGFALEIHHSLFSSGQADLTAALLAGATEAVLSAAQTPAALVALPPPGLHFLYLTTHLARHEEEGHSQLRLYNDLAAMIEYYGAEETAGAALRHASGEATAGAAPRHAGAGEMEKALRDRLGLLQSYLGLKLPEEYRFAADPQTESRFLAFLSKPKDNVPQKRPGHYREKLKAIPGFRRKCLWLLGDIFPSVEFMKRRYNKKSRLSVLPRYLLRPAKTLRLFR